MGYASMLTNRNNSYFTNTWLKTRRNKYKTTTSRTSWDLANDNQYIQNQ